MSENLLWEIVERDVSEEIGKPLNLISYMEHLVDLQTALIVELFSIIESTNTIPLETQTKLNLLKEFLPYASINFSQINSPFESYKIPKAIQIKSAIRDIQKIYLNAKLHEEGLI